MITTLVEERRKVVIHRELDVVGDVGVTGAVTDVGPVFRSANRLFWSQVLV
jgi:hypothetical protein